MFSNMAGRCGIKHKMFGNKIEVSVPSSKEVVQVGVPGPD